MIRVGIAALLLTGTMMAAVPASAQISIGVGVRLAPPPLPVYEQPPLPGPDYLWTPGFWAWDDYAEAYYWVPGTWVRAPRPGLLWTPPWWGWSGGLFVFHAGYWGPRIGFYGGVPYGFGYTGVGYQGGYWNGGHVFYNRTVNNVTNVNVTNVYRSDVTVNRITRVSYNGGPGGVQARPGPGEEQAARDPHVAPTGNQQAHVATARADPRAFAPANHGRPPLAATPRPLAWTGAPRPDPRQGFVAEAAGGPGSGVQAPRGGPRQPGRPDQADVPTRREGAEPMRDPSGARSPASMRGERSGYRPPDDRQPDQADRAPPRGDFEAPRGGRGTGDGMPPLRDRSQRPPAPRPHPAPRQPAPRPAPPRPPAPRPHLPGDHHRDDHRHG